MKALSVHQPWAWAIVHGIKGIENRSRRTYYRGPLLIHASKSRRELGDDYSELLPGLPPVEELPFGAIVGIVRLVDCVSLDEVEGDRFATGPWCWLLEEAQPIASEIAWGGQRGLFDFPHDIMSL
jgi:hypothetical protein